MIRKVLFIFCAPVCLAVLLTACLGTQHRAPVRHYGEKSGAGSAGIHTVMKGDTLWNISNRYRLSMPAIVQSNNLSPPYALDPGQRLRLPPPASYKVRGGDTLYGISRTFNTSMSEIARLNDLKKPYTLQSGQTLRLPSSPGPIKTKTATASKSHTSAAPHTKPKRAKKAALPKHTPKRSGSRFSWPVRGKVISSYGPKKDGLHNDGINIAAPKGSPVRAAENGTIVYAGRELKGFGNLVLIRHADRWMTAYAHMDRVLVKRGQTIKRGGTIGTAGSTGSVSTPQLHFEIRRGTKALNPTAYLER